MEQISDPKLFSDDDDNLSIKGPDEFVKNYKEYVSTSDYKKLKKAVEGKDIAKKMMVIMLLSTLDGDKKEKREKLKSLCKWLDSKPKIKNPFL